MAAEQIFEKVRYNVRVERNETTSRSAVKKEIELPAKCGYTDSTLRMRSRLARQNLHAKRDCIERESCRICGGFLTLNASQIAAHENSRCTCHEVVVHQKTP